MAFEENTINYIKSYVEEHMADWDWHQGEFDFITDDTLRDRLADEFISARYIYKMLEGMKADDWLLQAQIRIQILSYASIYEAVIHHLLFDDFKRRQEVVGLTEFNMKKVISIPTAKLEQLESALEHDGKAIIPTYEGIGRTDVTKVRFDKKAECAFKLGLIEEWLKDELVEIYEARNAIHIHAEIRKSLDYQLELSKTAYRRMRPFVDQIRANLPQIPKENV
ncbi:MULTISPECIES: hypothetical protein [Vibrio]|uniref:hypothetical protein n=1 Tax=Vibrio TaxID=662 RepID=UPI00215CFC4B|nr:MULTISPECIES: hypothetical protein [Vibrio]ELA7922261.1 hypothetical protein [Vibrio alginolyticus]ELE6591696.1 hypothetical protein [Vibrio alginolyticus]MCR9327575.1 hypothetical protein [Vibrio alginolyticus]MCR9356061.1 hypothetical protein [Vibrio alginolyticus]MCS0131129.1 hypothetical protein [Vibrio alginolyticus]